MQPSIVDASVIIRTVLPAFSIPAVRKIAGSANANTVKMRDVEITYAALKNLLMTNMLISAHRPQRIAPSIIADLESRLIRISRTN